MARGPKGLRGVTREVAFLDSLHRQATRLGGRAVGASVVSQSSRSFGADTLRALTTADKSTIGRVKSSVLADFSADGLEGPRSIAAATNSEWIWVANSSACPTCLSEHGTKGSGPFVPLHPSCLCIPESLDSDIRELSADELVSMQRKYGDPRYAKIVDDLAAGKRSMASLRGVEGVNLGRAGRSAVVEHRGAGVGAQSGLGGGTPTFLPNPDPLVAASKSLDAAKTQAKAATAAVKKSATAIADESGQFVKHPTQYGIKMPRDAARRALIEDAFAKMNELPVEAQKRFDHILSILNSPLGDGAYPEVAGRGIHFRVATASTKSLRELGKAGQMLTRRGQLIGGDLKLTLHMSRASDDWVQWVGRSNTEYRKVKNGTMDYYDFKQWKLANPEPVKWRLATADELADVIVHELGHLADFNRNAGSVGYAQIPATIKNEIRRMGWGGKPPSETIFDDAGKAVGVKRNTDVGERIMSYDYAMSSDAEAIAEINRFYYRGLTAETVPGESGAAADLIMTAQEWRAANPKIAAWFEETFING